MSTFTVESHAATCTGGTTYAGKGVFTRDQIGEKPVFHASWPSSEYTGNWWECAVSIP